MPRTGVANLPLHRGRAPRWLFERMRELAREIVIGLVTDGGPHGVLTRLSDPFWFQAFGCVLGFDWHSSGVTTTACGAIKEGIKGLEQELGVFACGGKGRASRRTPDEILGHGSHLDVDPEVLVYASRLSAKVDSSAVQDGYQVYHHSFFFTSDAEWCVVQQGMNEETGLARRYHWLSDSLEDFVNEPHSAVCCDAHAPTLNLVAEESTDARAAMAAISRERPVSIIDELGKVRTHDLPRRHNVALSDIDPKRLAKILLSTYEHQPTDFEALLGLKGVGPKALRALSLVSELVYGSAPSFEDPARFSFAHGGKDGFPYPVDRETYDRSISTLRDALALAKVGRSERLGALKRLATFTREAQVPPVHAPHGR